MDVAINTDGKAMPVEIGSSNPLYANYVNPNNAESAHSRVLRNYELLELIMRSMAVPKEGFEDQRIRFPDSAHLLQASLTCKDFYDPTMNVLWETIQSWSPILRLISVVTSGTFLTITEPILEEHLHRMDSYVRRIRKFVMGDSDESVSPQIYMALAKLRNFQIFPALVKLYIPSFDLHSYDIPSLSLMSSPTLSILDFSGISSHPVVFPLLHDISLGCSNIRKITLEGGLDVRGFKLLGCFPQLESLKLFLDGEIMPSISINELRPLSKLQNLKDFELYMDNLTTFYVPEGSLSTVLAFDALQLFQITSSASTALQMMQTMSFKFLRRASLFISSLDPAVDSVAMGLCFQLLVQRYSGTLRDLGVTTGGRLVYISRDVLKCLTDLAPQLQLLELDVDYIDKETMDLLTTSKCHFTLQTLRIRSNQPPPDAANLQASHIASFISQFPALQTLRMSVIIDMNADHVQTMRNITMHTERLTHPLRKMLLYPLSYGLDHESNIPVNVTVSTAYVFARYLNHYFPHLEMVVADYRFEESVHKWCEWVTTLTKEVQEEVSSNV